MNVKFMRDYDVSINYELCIHCEDCIFACKEGVFELDNEEQKVIVGNEANCSGCRDCIEICPSIAIYVGESLAKINAEREKRKEQAMKRESSFKELIEKHGYNESGDCKIPLNEILQTLDFNNEDDLDNWLINNDDFIAFRDENEVIVTPYESEE
ncbi:MAG: ferredoxin family protein [Asgard group archaeon]|nr:ferredoxin family protein [Asgard group archaeon]